MKSQVAAGAVERIAACAREYDRVAVPPDDEVDRLLALEDGWDTYDGRAPTEAAVYVAAAIKRNLTLVPLPSGGVQLEAHAGSIDLEIELRPDGKLRGIACEAFE